MKLKLDENLDTRLAALLKQAGHDVLTVRDRRLRIHDPLDDDD